MTIEKVQDDCYAIRLIATVYVNHKAPILRYDNKIASVCKANANSICHFNVVCPRASITMEQSDF